MAESCPHKKASVGGLDQCSFPLHNSRCFDRCLELSTSLLSVASWQQKSLLKSISNFLCDHHYVSLFEENS